jgi:hypothetical protein
MLYRWVAAYKSVAISKRLHCHVDGSLSYQVIRVPGRPLILPDVLIYDQRGGRWGRLSGRATDEQRDVGEGRERQDSRDELEIIQKRRGENSSQSELNNRF